MDIRIHVCAWCVELFCDDNVAVIVVAVSSPSCLFCTLDCFCFGARREGSELRLITLREPYELCRGLWLLDDTSPINNSNNINNSSLLVARGTLSLEDT